MIKVKITKAFFLTITISLIITACTSIQYTNPNDEDTTGITFSSTDLQLTTKKMVDSMLTSESIKRITNFNKKQPIIFFSGIRNETNEHINTNMLQNTVSTKIINSGLFRFTDMKSVRDMKNQIEYQQYSGMIDLNSAVLLGKQIGAHYMLTGSIANIDVVGASQQSMFFLVTLKILDIQKGIIVWQEDKQIRKVKKRRLFGW